MRGWRGPARAADTRRPGPIRVPSTMLSGTAPTPDGRPAALLHVVEIGYPAEPVPLRGLNESLLCCRQFHESAGSAMGPESPCAGPVKSRSVSIARKCSMHVRPRPAGQPVAVEVASQTPAEIAAVDGAGAADRRAAHDRDLAGRAIGELRLVALDQRAGGADRQPQPVGRLGAKYRIGQTDPGLQHSHRHSRSQPKDGLRQPIQRFPHR